MDLPSRHLNADEVKKGVEQGDLGLEGREEATVDADVLINALTGQDGVRPRPSGLGIWVSNLFVLSSTDFPRVDWGSRSIPYAVFFTRCHFCGPRETGPRIVSLSVQNVDARGLTFAGCEMDTLVAEELNLRGTLVLSGNTMNDVNLVNAAIRGRISVRGPGADNPSSGLSILGSGLRAKGSMYLPGGHFRELDLSNARIRGDLVLGTAREDAPDSRLTAGELCLSGSRLGALWVTNSSIGVAGSQVTSIDGRASVIARDLVVDPDVALNGDVDLTRSQISGDLLVHSPDSSTGSISVLELASITVAGVTQIVCINDAPHRENHGLETDSWESNKILSVNLADSTLSEVVIQGVQALHATERGVNNRSARMLMSVGSLPAHVGLNLRGARYEGISFPDEVVTTRGARRFRKQEAPELNVVRACSLEPFSGQPYLALARSKANMGDRNAARDALISMREDERRYGGLPFLTRVWYRISGFLVAYGYKVHHMLPWMALLVIAATLLVYSGQRDNYFMPVQPGVSVSNESAGEPGDRVPLTPAGTKTASTGNTPKSSECTDFYPCLEPVVYVLDAMIPIANFHQTDFWQPQGDWPGRWPFILLTVAVWLALTIFVSSISSVARREHEQSM
jgi:uncharacterized protein YjbI with pentapeptide repeats